jgi:hypothetical protein
MVSACVLELGVHYFCIIMDNPVSRFISGSAVAYVLYGVISEEKRYLPLAIALHMLMDTFAAAISKGRSTALVSRSLGYILGCDKWSYSSQTI